MCINFLKQFRRRPEEPAFGCNEPLCTISNIWFILLGLSRLHEIGEFHGGYVLMVFVGICSATHHATVNEWTIILDWIPIYLSIQWIFICDILYYATVGTWIKMITALLFLAEDHLIQRIPVPYGHAFWHILAAWSIDSLYCDSQELHLTIPWR